MTNIPDVKFEYFDTLNKQRKFEIQGKNPLFILFVGKLQKFRLKGHLVELNVEKIDGRTDKSLSTSGINGDTGEFKIPYAIGYNDTEKLTGKYNAFARYLVITGKKAKAVSETITFEVVKK